MCVCVCVNVFIHSCISVCVCSRVSVSLPLLLIRPQRFLCSHSVAHFHVCTRKQRCGSALDVFDGTHGVFFSSSLACFGAAVPSSSVCGCRKNDLFPPPRLGFVFTVSGVCTLCVCVCLCAFHGPRILVCIFLRHHENGLYLLAHMSVYLSVHAHVQCVFIPRHDLCAWTC